MRTGRRHCRSNWKRKNDSIGSGCARMKHGRCPIPIPIPRLSRMPQARRCGCAKRTALHRDSSSRTRSRNGGADARQTSGRRPSTYSIASQGTGSDGPSTAPDSYRRAPPDVRASRAARLRGGSASPVRGWRDCHCGSSGPRCVSERSGRRARRRHDCLRRAMSSARKGRHPRRPVAPPHRPSWPSPSRRLREKGRAADDGTLAGSRRARAIDGWAGRVPAMRAPMIP